MKTWYYASNSLKRFNSGVVILETKPWYVVFIGWLFDGPLSCAHIPAIPFPDWFPKARDEDDPESKQTLKEWYGDLGQLYHVHVCSPVSDWEWEHPKKKEYSIDMTYDELRKIFYSDGPEYFEDADKLEEKYGKDD